MATLGGGGGAQTNDFAKVYPKLHAFQGIWTGGGQTQNFAFVDPPVGMSKR